MSEALLAGLRVVELSSFVAAPLGGMTLAQLGADVIRVDPLGGAADRHRWPLAPSGTSMYWAGLNKAKRSITVDLGSQEGRRLVSDLITAPGPDAGVLLTNTVGRDFLDDGALRARRNDLIHVQIRGRYDGGTAVDYTVNAGVGFPLVTGPAGTAGPVNNVVPAWDIATGLYAALAVASAERRRARTGEGSLIRVNLEDVALATAGNLGYLAEAQINRIARPRTGNDVYGSFGRDFACGDGRRVMVVALTPRQWDDLVGVTGTGSAVAALESALGVDFRAEGDRYRHIDALWGLMSPWFAARRVDEVAAALSPTAVLWQEYRSFAELVADPEGTLRANPLMTTLDQPGVGPHLAPGGPLSVDGHIEPAVPAPTLGQHGIEVLTELLGLSADECRSLVDRGVIGEVKGTAPGQ